MNLSHKFMKSVMNISLSTMMKQLPSTGQNVAITIGWKEEWAGKLLANASLEWVQAISAGVDTLPLAQFAQKNILLSNGSGIHAQSITDHLIALLFMESRGIFTAIKNRLKDNGSPMVFLIHYYLIKKY